MVLHNRENSTSWLQNTSKEVAMNIWSTVTQFFLKVVRKALNLNSKGKGKGHPRTGHEGPEVEQMYSSTLSLTSALVRVGGQRNVPAALHLGKIRYPLYRRLGGPQGSSWVRKISPPPGFDPQIVQPVASHYTDWAIPAHRILIVEIVKCWVLSKFGSTIFYSHHA
jgi:hypothetical protein